MERRGGPLQTFARSSLTLLVNHGQSGCQIDVSILGGRKVEIGCYGRIPAAKRERGAKAASYSFVHQQLNASSLRSPALVEMEDATEAALNKSHRVRLQ